MRIMKILINTFENAKSQMIGFEKLTIKTGSIRHLELSDNPSNFLLIDLKGFSTSYLSNYMDICRIK